MIMPTNMKKNAATLEESTNAAPDEIVTEEELNAAASPSVLANMFTSAAVAAVSGSPVIADFRKYKGRDIAAMYPEGVFIADFDIITVRDRNSNGEMKTVAVYNFSDTSNGAVIGYTLGGAVINRLISEWIAKIGGGDIETARDLYSKSGSRVRVKLSYEVNQATGNTIQKVVIN